MRARRPMSSAARLIVLKKGNGTHDPVFAPDEARALAPNTETVFLGLLDGAARFGIGIAPGQRRSAEDARRSVRHRSALDRGAGPGRAGSSAAARRGQGDAALARAAPLLLELRRHDRHGARPAGSATARPARSSISRAPIRSSSCWRCDGDRGLLGRSGRFAATMWSCLAGFVEPGEAIEDAVRRETLEEAGIVAARVKYFYSQPWPFPMSLMIGCHAEALERRSSRWTANELVDARWFTKDECAAMLMRRASGWTDLSAAGRDRAPHHPRLGRERRRCPLLGAPTILCAGIAVLDIVFRVEQFPQPGGKCMTNEFIIVSGGCAVNAAIAIARLGGARALRGPARRRERQRQQPAHGRHGARGHRHQRRGARRRRHRAGVGDHGRRGAASA